MKTSLEKESLRRWEEVIENRIMRVGEDGDSFTVKSSETPENNQARNQYHRDFDRLIFSSSFKRLQNKTQVFPLPGTAQVHNRLTHSLEVSSVGRSLGSLVGNEIAKLLEENKFSVEVIDFYRYELKDVILAACLAHDIGNPCFGHSGERIISDYFAELRDRYRDDTRYRIKHRKNELDKISDAEWDDLSHFEGNANTLRMLTHEYFGKLPGGLRLTYLTLASSIKYPWDVVAVTHSQSRLLYQKIKKKKYGFFQEQKELMNKIASSFNLFYDESGNGESVFRRHPFVYLVEAADDICYTIMDLEDAQKIRILPAETVRGYFWDLCRELSDKFFSDSGWLLKMKNKEESIVDEHEKVVYLRSKSINILTEVAGKVFIDNWKNILEGSSEDLIKIMTDRHEIRSLKKIQEVSVSKIYNHRTVTETMVGASYILPELLDWFLPAILTPDNGEHSYREKNILSLINPQFWGGDFEMFKKISPYQRILSLLDFLTGMTDEYIAEYYRKLKGIDSTHHFL